jgi:hypothetical protein
MEGPVINTFELALITAGFPAGIIFGFSRGTIFHLGMLSNGNGQPVASITAGFNFCMAASGSFSDYLQEATKIDTGCGIINEPLMQSMFGKLSQTLK